MTTAAAYKDGLEDIIAARSAICRVDGEAGRLYYRGYEVADLVGAASFEDTTRLLWFGELPSAAERVEFGARLVETRPLPPPVLDLLRRLPRECHPLDALRTAVSLAAAADPDVRSDEPAANLRKAYRLMNLVPARGAAGSASARAASRLPRGPAAPTQPTSSTARRQGAVRGGVARSWT